MYNRVSGSTMDVVTWYRLRRPSPRSLWSAAHPCTLWRDTPNRRTASVTEASSSTP